MRKVLLVAFAAMLAGCGEDREMCYSVPVQDSVRAVFEECLRSLPAGPVQTHYNDWAEVVSECRSFAYDAADKETKCFHYRNGLFGLRY